MSMREVNNAMDMSGVTVLHPQASEFVNKDIIPHFPQIQIFSGKFGLPFSYSRSFD